MKRKLSKSEEYGLAVATAIASLFKDEEEVNQVYHYELDTLNATEFFTGIVKGSNYIYRQLTGTFLTNLEFTHMCNQLIVQDLLKAKKGDEGKDD